MKKLLLIFLACSSAAMVHAQITFYANLDGAQETPAVVTTGIGTASLSLNPNNTVSFTINFQNLVGTTTAAHIHGPAAIGVGPAGVVVGLPGLPLGVTSGSWSGTTVALTSGQVSDLLNGLHYINIHSSYKSGGEIRGQILVVPEPTSLALAGLGGLLLSARIMRRSR